MCESEDNIPSRGGNFAGFVLNPAKCSQLSLGQKRELVHEIIQYSDDAPQILSSFSRRELLEIICAEMGKKRKYTGLTKGKMIGHLLKIVTENSKKENTNDLFAFHLTKSSESGPKKLKRNEHPVDMCMDPSHSINVKEEDIQSVVCENVACRAILSPDYGFCKRCSCCICHKFDDNKDPSLWLTCDADPPSVSDSCGMSCHLICAYKHERAGMMETGSSLKLDGRFRCVSCGKVNDLMSTWKKQLMVAKDARRVDVLCLRISLCYKILDGTEQYKDLHKLVDGAVKKLKKELGPLDRVCTKMGRGIVNRLACGADVLKLCASALEAFDNLSNLDNHYPMEQKQLPTLKVHFEECSPTSVLIVLDYEDHLFEGVVGFRLWHRKSSSKTYPENPTCIILCPEKTSRISDLNRSTEYSLKVSFFSCTGTVGTWEGKWVTPSSPLHWISDSEEDRPKEQKIILDQDYLKLRSLDDINDIPFRQPLLMPATPSKVDGKQDLRQAQENEYEYCVRVIKFLEREGHLNMDFRVKFLTWFSLKAKVQERRVVSAFVDAMIDDPPSLAEQLFDSFAEEICVEKPVSDLAACPRSWH